MKEDLEKEEQKEENITPSSPEDTAGEADAPWGEADTARTTTRESK